MSPDIEWRVGEDAEQETIAKVTTDKSRRWRMPLVLIATALGIGLGAIYVSIPEPPPKPIVPATATARPIAVVATTAPITPTATPTPQPPPVRSALENAILREAHALADGDPAEYMTQQDPSLYLHRQDALSLYSVWGRPADQPYYTIQQTGTINADTAWAEVVQYRDGQFLRDMRFFRLINDQWKRTRTARADAFWGVTQTVSTDHFTAIYRTRDVQAVADATTYLDQRYAQVCQTFGCADQPDLRALTIVFQPGMLDASTTSDEAGRSLTVTLPSPGPLGLYYSTLDATTLGRNPQLDNFFDRYLLMPALFAAAGGAQRWSAQGDGAIYVYAVGQWELRRQGRSSAEFPYRPGSLASNAPLLSLDKTWTAPLSDDEARAQSSALIQFIDETHGPDTVIQFFKALRMAHSLSQALESAGLPYNDFTAQWTSWLKQQQHG
jgi:hypothetical protein